MPFKSWGTPIPFEKYYQISFTEYIPQGKTLGIYGYQPIPATLSQEAFNTLQNFDLDSIVSAIQTQIPDARVQYAQLAWNAPGGTYVTDLVLGLVIYLGHDVFSAQQILNTIFTTSLGGVLVEAHMNQINAWVAYRLHEAPPIDWLLVAGVGAAVVIGLGIAVALAR